MKSHSQMIDLILHSGYAAYLNACSKHPFFCDRICCDSTDWAGLAKDIKEHIQFHAEQKDGNCTARDVINAELCEVYEAFIRGDYAHARRELMDVFAVLMRMDDMIAGMEPTEGEGKMNQEEIINAFKNAGYSYNPYSGDWMKVVGEEKYLSILPGRDGAIITLWNHGKPLRSEWGQTVADAIAAGEKWLAEKALE